MRYKLLILKILAMLMVTVGLFSFTESANAINTSSSGSVTNSSYSRVEVPVSVTNYVTSSTSSISVTNPYTGASGGYVVSGRYGGNGYYYVTVDGGSVLSTTDNYHGTSYYESFSGSGNGCGNYSSSKYVSQYGNVYENGQYYGSTYSGTVYKNCNTYGSPSQYWSASYSSSGGWSETHNYYCSGGTWRSSITGGGNRPQSVSVSAVSSIGHVVYFTASTSPASHRDSGSSPVVGSSCTGSQTMTAYRTYTYPINGSTSGYTADTQSFSGSYSGTIYAPGNYKYGYNVVLPYTSNVKPVVTLNDIGGRYSDKTGHNVFNVSGTVRDSDSDTVNIRYSFGGVTGTLGSINATPTATGYSYDITVTSSVPEGNNTLSIWADDNVTGGVGDSVTKNIIVDKTHPTITHTLNPASWTTGNVTITPTGVDPSGVRSVSPTSTLATDNGTYNFTTVDNLSNSGIRSVTITTIDRVAPTITIVSDGNGTYEKSHSTIVNVVDTRDGTNGGSGNKKLEYSWSTDPNVPGTYTEFTTGNTITTPPGVTGDYYLHVKAEDNLGQVSTDVSNVFKVDNTVPEVGNLVLSLDGVGRILATVSGISDLHAGIEISSAHSYRLDSGSYTGWIGSSNTFTGLQGNRVYDVTYKIRDKAGNEAIVSVPKKLRSMTFHPISLNVSGLTVNSISLGITEGNNVLGSSYEIYTKNLSGTEIGTKSSFNTALTNRTVSGLNTNEQYSIWARSKNIDGVSTLPDIKLLDKYVGADVPGLDFTAVTTNSMSFDIDKNLNPVGTQYLVERALDSNFTSGKVVLNNWLTSLSVNSTGLTPGQEYFYRIKARNGDNVETSWSQVYSYKSIPSQVVLAQPTVSAYDHSKDFTGINLSWTSVLGGDKYYIYRDGVKIDEVNGNVLTYVDNQTNFNKNSTYNVSAWNAQGEGVKSAERSLFDRARNIDGLEITNLTDTVATFKVNHSNKNVNVPASYIEVRRKGTTTIVGTNAYNKATTNRNVTGLQLGVAYEVWVTVRNENNIANPAVKIIDEFYMNRPPEIKLELGNDKYSEVVGFNNILVRGQVKDPDTIPVGDPLDIYYTIKNSSGVVVSDHNNVRLGRETATGTWQNINYDIPLTDSLIEGNYTIEVKVIDDQLEQVIDTKPFLVDRTIPVGKLKEIDGPKSYELTNEVYDVDGNIAGLHATPYSIYRAENKKAFKELVTWRNVITYKDNLSDYKTESNTKYSYKVQIRDLVGHLAETNLVEFVTSPKVKDRDEDYLVNDPSSIVIEWEKPLVEKDGVSIEVRRNGHLIGVLLNGDRFIDSNLDYERDYKYQLIAVSETFDGKRLASVPIDLTLTTGQPLIEFTLDTDYIGALDLYEVKKTIFSEYAYVGSEVFYRPGGNVEISFKDTKGQFSDNLRLSPYETRKYPLSLMISDGQEVSLRAGLLNGSVDISVDIKAKGKLKLPEIEDIDSAGYLKRVK